MAACCQLDAYDHHAVRIAWWLERVGDNGALARRQLDDLIADVCAHDGPVRSTWRRNDAAARWPTFETEWPTGDACAAYLREWQAEFARTLSLEPRPVDPNRWLAQAAARGFEDLWRVAECLSAEANQCIHDGDEPRAIEILSPIITGLEDERERLESEMAYARRRLAALRGSPGEASDAAGRDA